MEDGATAAAVVFVDGFPAPYARAWKEAGGDGRHEQLTRNRPLDFGWEHSYGQYY